MNVPIYLIECSNFLTEFSIFSPGQTLYEPLCICLSVFCLSVLRFQKSQQNLYWAADAFGQLTKITGNRFLSYNML